MVAIPRLLAVSLALSCLGSVASAATPQAPQKAASAKPPAPADDFEEDDSEPPPAAPPALLDKMVALNRKALGELSKGKAADAKATLLGAILLGKESGIAQHPVMARTYLHLGAVHVNGLNDKAAGLRFLKMAVKLRPQISLTPELVTPALTQAFASAGGRTSAGAGKAPTTPAAAPSGSPAQTPAHK